MHSPSSEPNPPNLSLKDLGAVLVKSFGLHEGLYDVSFEVIMGGGKFMDDQGHPIPGAFLGIRQVGLVRTEQNTPSTVDAAEVNPLPAARKKARSRKPA